jgi:hypothetical protein
VITLGGLVIVYYPGDNFVEIWDFCFVLYLIFFHTS